MEIRKYCQSRLEPLTVCDHVAAGTRVNILRCQQFADFIRAKDVPRDREEFKIDGLGRLEAGNFYLLLVAICHQTSPFGGVQLHGMVDGNHLRGWDYLAARLKTFALNHREVLTIARWAELGSYELQSIFEDQVYGRTLSDIEGRVQLINDLGRQMIANDWSYAEDLFTAAAGTVSALEPNLLGLLRRFKAYSDPVQKKSIYFLTLMQNSGLWTYTDPENLGPPVDYHEVRGHLRLGTVEILDPLLFQKISHGQPVSASDDISIRKSVFDAILLISQFSGISPAQLHYLFWNVFRACCTRVSPHCQKCSVSCSLPTRYVPLAMRAGGERHCPFSDVCASANHDEKIQENIIETEFY